MMMLSITMTAKRLGIKRLAPEKMIENNKKS